MKQSLQYLSITLLSFFLLSSAEAQNHQDNRDLQEMGRKLERTGRELLRIIDRYSQQVHRNPNDAIAYNNRGAAYFDKGNYREAIIDYTQALRLYSPSHYSHRARMHYKRGLCCFALGEFDKAEADFSEAISLRPDVADSYYFRGKIKYLVKGNSYLARADMLKVLRKTSAPSVQRAFAHFFLGEEERALREANGILNGIPRRNRYDYALMSYNYAGLLALAQRPSEAVNHLRQALDYGYAGYEWLIRDINFSTLANNRDFIYLLSRYNLRYIGASNAPNPAVVIINQEPRDRPREEPSSQITGSTLQFSDDNGNGSLDAGEDGYISFKVVNDGPGRANRVNIEVRELNGSYGINFAKNTKIGDIFAGESRNVKIGLQGTEELLDGQAEFEIRVREVYGHTARPMRIIVPLSSYQPPILEVTEHHFASEMGGRMRPGVPAILKLAVQNLGRGPAEGVLLDFELPDNVFTAGSDRYDLGTLKPGENSIVDFEFFTNRRYSQSDVSIRAIIKDRKGTYSQRQTFIVKVDQELEVADRVIITGTSTPANIPTTPEEIQLVSDVDRNLPRTLNKNPDAIAVVIGNRDYTNPDVPSVDYALQDAAAMRKYLEKSYGFDPTNILFVANATQADFNGIFGTNEDHRARLFNLIKPDVSDVFIFYSGHGAPDLQSEEAYFVPVDCDPSLVRFNGYAINTFYENLSKIPYKSMTVVIDACFSGASAKGTLIPRASLVRIKSKNSTILTDPKAAVFTSATGTQIASWYPEQQHGLFTYYFLKGLQGEANANRDRKLTLAEMKAYLDDQVPYQARRMNNRVQTPEVYGREEAVILDY